VQRFGGVNRHWFRSLRLDRYICLGLLLDRFCSGFRIVLLIDTSFENLKAVRVQNRQTKQSSHNFRIVRDIWKNEQNKIGFGGHLPCEEIRNWPFAGPNAVTEGERGKSNPPCQE
jgi:hypothetical protein